MALGAVERGVRQDLQSLDEAARSGSLAKLCLNLARRMDNTEVMKPSDAAVITRELRATMLALLALTPAKPVEKDIVDELAAKRTRTPANM